MSTPQTCWRYQPLRSDFRTALPLAYAPTASIRYSQGPEISDIDIFLHVKLSEAVEEEEYNTHVKLHVELHVQVVRPRFIVQGTHF
jgi:hypothetical protein